MDFVQNSPARVGFGSGMLIRAVDGVSLSGGMGSIVDNARKGGLEMKLTVAVESVVEAMFASVRTSDRCQKMDDGWEEARRDRTGTVVLVAAAGSHGRRVGRQTSTTTGRTPIVWRGGVAKADTRRATRFCR